ncbi:MAG: hypothetical protein QXW98_07260 [Candidatus Caldarchaeum sp.]
MRRGLTGRYEVTVVAGERIQTFIPDPLPPNPPLELNVQRVVREITGRRRNRVFVYHDYLNILSEGTEAL